MSNGLIKGQGLVLITGKKGSGKSHFTTSQIKYIVDNHADHAIYADIEGLDIDGVQLSPDDWQNAPNNSTIIYDEAQRLSWADNSSTKIASDERVKEMTMIRHQNKNIVLIAQDPTFIHSALRKLVDVHYHISHPFKDGKPKVFKFIGAMSTIDEKGLYKTHAVETFTHELDADISKLYKSVDPDATHDQKKSIPKKIKMMIGGILLLIFVLIPVGLWGFGKVYSFITGASDRTEETMKEVNTAKSNIDGTGLQNPFTDNQTPEAVQELHQKYLQPYTLEVAHDDLVRPSAILSMGGTCKAYNMYGDLLTIDNERCLFLMDNPAQIPQTRNISTSRNSTADRQYQREISSNDTDYITNTPPPIQGL